MIRFIAGVFTLFELYSFSFYQSFLYLSLTICWGFLPRTPGFSLDILLKRLLSHLRFHYRYLQETQAHPDININSTDWMLNTLFGLKVDVSSLLCCIAHVTEPVNTTDSSGLRSACAVPTLSIIVAFLFWWFVRQTRGNQHSEPLVFGCSSTNWLSGLLCCRRNEIIPTQGSPTGTNANSQHTHDTRCTYRNTVYSTSCLFLLTFNLKWTVSFFLYFWSWTVGTVLV